jgi:hypothetical protein
VSVQSYDLSRLDGLRRNVRTAADDLAGWRVDDPAAAAAMQIARSIQSTLEDVLLSLVTDVLHTDPLGGIGRSGPACPVPPLLVRSIGDFLARPLQDWADELDDLALARFNVTMRLQSDPNDQDLLDELARLDLAIADGGARYLESTRPHTGPPLLAAVAGPAWNPDVLALVQPYTAALMLRTLDLTDHDLALASTEVLARWWASDDTELWDALDSVGDNPADFIFATLAARPAAATEFLLMSGPEIVLMSSEFDRHVRALLVVGTSPDRVDSATAAAILRPIVDWSVEYGDTINPATDGTVHDLRALVGVVMTPWLGEMGPRAGDWGWTEKDGDVILRWIVETPTGLAAMSAAISTWQDRLATMPLVLADGRIDSESLRDLTKTFAQLQIAIRDEAIDDAAAARLMLDITLMVATTLISISGKATLVGAIASEAGAMAFTPLANLALDRLGIVPTAEHSEEMANDALADAATRTAVLAVVGMIGQFIEQGKLPADVLDSLNFEGLGAEPGPEAVGNRLQDYLSETISPVSDPLTFTTLFAVASAFSNSMSEKLLAQ